MVFQINSCIYIYICILVPRCDGSQRAVRSTPHQAFTFENITAVVIDLHMFRHCFYYVFFKLIHNHMQVCIRTKQQKTENNKTHVETHVQNLHAAQAISRTPNQRVNRNMFSATEDFDPPMEI